MLFKAYLSLKFKNCFRQLMELGPLCALLTFFSLSQLFHEELYTLNTLLYWTILLPCLMIGIHNNRSDKVFIKMYFKRVFFVFFGEYLLLCFPLLVPMLIYGAYFHLIVVLTAIFIAVVVPMKLTKINVIPTIFPALSLDWNNGLRRSYLPFALLFSAALAGVFSDNLRVIEVVIYISVILATDFNTAFEPAYYLLQYSGQSIYTLIRIIRSSLISFLIFNSPFLLALLFATKDPWLFLRMAGTIAVFHPLLILLKYAVFRTLNALSYSLLKVFLLAILMVSFYLERLEYLILIPPLFLFALKRITKIIYG